jgi:ABC-type lipoprotein export system ATPase subunit
MNERSGTTFLMVTHNTDLARQARRRMRMDRGSMREL